MNYRQWKKKYKKINGYNPQRKITSDPVGLVCSQFNFEEFRKALSKGLSDAFNATASIFNTGATVCAKIASELYPVFVENGMRLEVRSVVSGYGVYVNGERRLITNR